MWLVRLLGPSQAETNGLDVCGVHLPPGVGQDILVPNSVFWDEDRELISARTKQAVCKFTGGKVPLKQFATRLPVRVRVVPDRVPWLWERAAATKKLPSCWSGSFPSSAWSKRPTCASCSAVMALQEAQRSLLGWSALGHRPVHHSYQEVHHHGQRHQQRKGLNSRFQMYYMGCFLRGQLNPVDMYVIPSGTWVQQMNWGGEQIEHLTCLYKYFTNLHCGSRAWKQLSDSN